MSTELNEHWQRAADLAERAGEPRCHADELMDVARMLRKHGHNCASRDYAISVIEDIADQVRAWARHTAAHHGALPPDVVSLHQWKRRAKR